MKDTRLDVFGHTVILETECPDCHGIGRIVPETHSDDIERICEECNGTGYLLTANGKELARFIQHQFGLIPKQYIDLMYTGIH